MDLWMKTYRVPAGPPPLPNVHCGEDAAGFVDPGEPGPALDARTLYDIARTKADVSRASVLSRLLNGARMPLIRATVTG